MERDFYLSMSAMLSTVIVVGTCYWIDKFDKIVKTKDTEIKGIK